MCSGTEARFVLKAASADQSAAFAHKQYWILKTVVNRSGVQMDAIASGLLGKIRLLLG